ncbi:putative serine carboxypeptidase CPVL [Brevipalpus obovatus]|uniref:putative serine carboxypeptidase CPVL n=1 Tax=Brevipalpus obovatus TaxID=246614 RepID=UPI003D9EC9C6
MLYFTLFALLYANVVLSLPLNVDHEQSPLFLSQFIKSNQSLLAKESAKVVNLPNAPNITSYAGYFTVNETTNSNLFFWFFPCEDPKAPVAIWLQGGPGAASTFGLFTEHGPFVVHADMTVGLRNYTWTKMLSMLYIDQPVGTGFSFTDSEEGYRNTQEEIGSDLYVFLQHFYQVFPEQRPNDLWISGESYAGKYVPAIAYKLYQERATSQMNFKGVAIGDGYVDGMLQNNYADLLYQIGMFDENEARKGRKIEQQVRELAIKGEYRQCHDVLDAYIDGDRAKTTLFTNSTGSRNYYNFLQVTNAGDPYGAYLARDDVRQAIHVGNHTMSDGNKVYDHLIEDECKSVKHWLEELIDAGYETLLYNGQLDVIVGPVITERLIQNMTWKGKDDYLKAPKNIWRVPSQPKNVAGYVKSYKNFHFAIVRNTGHMVPTDQPASAYDLIERLINGKLG